jgi:hypothetical protein
MFLLFAVFYFAVVTTVRIATASVTLILFKTKAYIASVPIFSAVLCTSLLYFLLYFSLDPHLLAPLLTQQHLLVLTLQRNVTGFSTIQIYVNYQREPELNKIQCLIVRSDSFRDYLNIPLSNVIFDRLISLKRFSYYMQFYRMISNWQWFEEQIIIFSH